MTAYNMPQHLLFRWSSHAPLAWLSTKKGDSVVNKRSALVLLMLTTFCHGANATDAQGWRWYNEPTAPKKQAPKKAETPSVTLTRTQTLTPTEQMDWFHSYYQDTLNDAAINSQDSTKVEKAMLLNQYVSNKSSEFGMTFKKYYSTTLSCLTPKIDRRNKRQEVRIYH